MKLFCLLLRGLFIGQDLPSFSRAHLPHTLQPSYEIHRHPLLAITLLPVPSLSSPLFVVNARLSNAF
jgi:hypothetical protein